MSSKKHGRLIAIDGPDGVGKTTQVMRLVEYLETRNVSVHKTRHSGGTSIGKELRAVSLSSHSRPPETDFYISLAMHADLVGQIKQNKEAGKTIIMDRSPLTMLAYNGFGGEMPDIKIAFAACEKMFEELYIDELIFLSASPETIEKRRTLRGAKDYFETKSKTYHKRVFDGYREGVEFLKLHPRLCKKVVIIDGNENVETIHAQIIDALPVSD